MAASTEQFETLEKLCEAAGATELLKAIRQAKEINEEIESLTLLRNNLQSETSQLRKLITEKDKRKLCWVVPEICNYGCAGYILDATVGWCVQCHKLQDHINSEAIEKLKGLFANDIKSEVEDELIKELKNETKPLSKYLEEIVADKDHKLEGEEPGILLDFIKILTEKLDLHKIEILESKYL